MTTSIVERTYTYVGAQDPTLFYYHTSCWQKVALPGRGEMPELTEGVVVEVARGTVRLVQQVDLPSVASKCQQCEQSFGR